MRLTTYRAQLTKGHRKQITPAKWVSIRGHSALLREFIRQENMTKDSQLSSRNRIPGHLGHLDVGTDGATPTPDCADSEPLLASQDFKSRTAHELLDGHERKVTRWVFVDREGSPGRTRDMRLGGNLDRPCKCAVPLGRGSFNGAIQRKRCFVLG
jgi:hypothetical protein